MASGSAAPRSILRPYNHDTDAGFLPKLLRDHTLAWIRPATVAFLSSPLIVSLCVAICAALLNVLYNRLFLSHLAVPEELEEAYHWEDYFALGIYAVIPIAGVVANFFGIAYWLHRRIWMRFAERSRRGVDVLDVESYYKGKGSNGSSFWCLEFEKEIAACFALDARNPTSLYLQVMQDAEHPEDEDLKEPAKPAEPVAEIIDDEDARDLALFRHANTGAVGEQDGTLQNLQDATAAAAQSTSIYTRDFTEADYVPPASAPILPGEDTKNVAQLRHLAVNQNFTQVKKVEDYLLKMAINAAFSKSTAARPVDQLVLVLQPRAEKALRSAALGNGFRIVGTLPLDSTSQTEGIKGLPWSNGITRMLEAVLGKVWPISLDQEILVLERSKADKRLVAQ